MKKKQLDRFKKYVKTYKETDTLTEEIFILDMIYGIGIALDKKEYQYTPGMRKFCERIRHLVASRYDLQVSREEVKDEVS